MPYEGERLVQFKEYVLLWSIRKAIADIDQASDKDGQPIAGAPLGAVVSDLPLKFATAYQYQYMHSTHRTMNAFTLAELYYELGAKLYDKEWEEYNGEEIDCLDDSEALCEVRPCMRDYTLMCYVM